ncbi:MAG TPA: hypothetical protein VEO19_07985 [Terriglobia bacterium]|nr:hypothetical protein [Terriglobia bacterium]
MPSLNDIASAADFRKFAEDGAFEEPRRVVLPKSGYGVVLRRPTKFYWALRRSAWPRGLREKLDLVGVGVRPELTAEETLLLVREDRQMLNEAFVDPKPSLDPGSTQFDPNWLPKEDAEFILKYLRGQVLANGQNLETFSGGEPGHPEGSGGDGALVRQNAERDAIPSGGSLAS